MMTQTNINNTEASDTAEQMTKYGITRNTVEQFHFGDYRYSNFRDALAQAKRTAETMKSGDGSVSA